MEPPLHVQNIDRDIRFGGFAIIFPVGVTMHTPAVECYKEASLSSPLLYNGAKG